MFITCFTPMLYAGEMDIPLPQDAVKVSGSVSADPLKSYFREYKTSLNKDELTSFYKKAMLKSGWEEEKGEEGIFMKGSNIAVITVSPPEDKQAKTDFVISITDTAKEDFQAMRKKNPDKLNFMPLYPGSEQVYLWDLDHGVFAQYETENSIKNVAFFYKSAMLNYGWNLVSETPNALEFSRAGDETCEIEMSSVSFKKSTLPIPKTTISVTYHKNEKTKLF